MEAKIWKIRNNTDIKYAMIHIQVRPEYINFLLSIDSDFMYYLDGKDGNTKPKYVYVGWIEKNEGWFNDKNWGWFEENNTEILLRYKYCGEINLRKEKIKKLNDLY